MSDKWTEERTKLAREMWADGQSASVIAQAVRGGISRNAVIGKVHRDGWTRGAPPPDGWTDERKRQVLALCRQSYRMETIAAKIGGGLTAEDVTEMVARLRVEPHAVRKIYPTFFKAGAAVKAAPVSRRAPLPKAGQGGEAVDISTTFPGEGVTILDLEADACRWPKGYPRALDSFRYCGATQQAGSPYCAFHRGVAYQPSAQRPRARREPVSGIRLRIASSVMQDWA